MRPGDKVRFLHSTGDGVIRKILDTKTVEVEIEDGFIVPALRSEIVVIHSHETNIAKGEESAVESEGADNGALWFAFAPFNDKNYTLFILNESNKEILFTLGEEDAQKKYRGIYSGVLKSSSSVKITEVSIANFDHWPEYIFQGLQFQQGISEIKEPIFKRLKFKAATFFKSKQKISLLEKEAYAFKLEEGQLTVADPKKIVEEMFSNKEPEPLTKKSLTKPAKEVDLHIENLIDDFSKLSNAEILELQLKTFEKILDNAIAMGMEEIIFIHGVGNGVLRQNIHKSLSRNKNIQFFQDARKEKFGYGATSVKIK